MAFEEYTTQISEARKNLSQRYADQPKYADALRAELYNKEGALPSLRENRDAQIRALYDADTRMADRYANPTSELFIKNPYTREQLLSNQHKQELGEVQTTQQMLKQRENVLGDILQKGLDLYNYGLKASEFEFNALQQQLDNAMKIAEYQDKKRAASGSGTKRGPTIKQIQDAYRSNYDNAQSPQYTPKTPGTREMVNGIGFTYDVKKGWVKDAYQVPDNPIFKVPADVALLYEDYPEESAKVAADMVGYQIKPDDNANFGWTQAEVGAGVAGLPKSQENVNVYQQYINSKSASGEDQNWWEMLGVGTTTQGSPLSPSPTAGASATLNTGNKAQAAAELQADIANYLADPSGPSKYPDIAGTLDQNYTEFSRAEIENYLRNAGVRF